MTHNEMTGGFWNVGMVLISCTFCWRTSGLSQVSYKELLQITPSFCLSLSLTLQGFRLVHIGFKVNQLDVILCFLFQLKL